MVVHNTAPVPPVATCTMCIANHRPICVAAGALSVAILSIPQAKSAYSMPKPTDAQMRKKFAEIERKYGITEVEYRALYRMQGGVCAICRVAKGVDRMLAVDHDHVTGQVRGLLCSGSLSAITCNRLIGWYSLAKLRRAVSYLSNPPAVKFLAGLRRGETPCDGCGGIDAHRWR